MLHKTLSDIAASLAVGMVMLFSGIEIWWAVDTLVQISQRSIR